MYAPLPWPFTFSAAQVSPQISHAESCIQSMCLSLQCPVLDMRWKKEIVAKVRGVGMSLLSNPLTLKFCLHLSATGHKSAKPLIAPEFFLHLIFHFLLWHSPTYEFSVEWVSLFVPLEANDCATCEIVFRHRVFGRLCSGQRWPNIVLNPKP